MKNTMAACAAVLLAGCVTLNASPVQTARLGPIEPGAPEVTIMNPTQYAADMAVELSKRGVQLRPIPSDETVSRTDASGSTANKRAYATRYGLDLQMDPTRTLCVFTDHYIVNAKATLIDLRTNMAVAVVTQRGANGPCTSVEPVFPGIAQAVSELLAGRN